MRLVRCVAQRPTSEGSAVAEDTDSTRDPLDPIPDVDWAMEMGDAEDGLGPISKRPSKHQRRGGTYPRHACCCSRGPHVWHAAQPVSERFSQCRARICDSQRKRICRVYREARCASSKAEAPPKTGPARVSELYLVAGDARVPGVNGNQVPSGIVLRWSRGAGARLICSGSLCAGARMPGSGCAVATPGFARCERSGSRNHCRLAHRVLCPNVARELFSDNECAGVGLYQR